MNNKKIPEWEKRFDINIGMLRQWLNEDRIKDVDKFVTNEQLKMFFTKTTNKGLKII